MNATAAARNSELAAGLVRAGGLLRQGQAEQAIAHCRTLLDAFPDHWQALRYLGLALLQAQHFADAERHFAQALRLEPASADLLNDLGVARLRQEAPDDALASFNRALDIDARHGDALGNIVALFTEQNQPVRARPYVQRLLAAMPFSGAAHATASRNSLLLDDAEHAVRMGRKAVRFAGHLAEARLTLAEALETSGRFRQAKFQYLAVLGRDPRQVTALTRLLSMKQTAIDARYAREALALVADTALPEAERAQLHLALARYYDQCGEYDEAFAQLGRGNAIRWEKQDFDSALFSEAVDRIIAAFPQGCFDGLPQPDAASSRPIFIVGMPRSGTTLVEQILASHPAVSAGGELSAITALAADVNAGGEPYPRGVAALDGDARERLAQNYLDRLRKISPDAPRVTDKMPFNFMHLGFIATLFPAATIMHCRRDPLDTCLSCYFTSFGENLLFAGDLESLGRYYCDYRRLMEHWRAVLPTPMLEVDYERVVSATEDTVRAMLAHCQLEWDEACLYFYRTDRGIRTPSRWQVRQPIYDRSVQRWRHYEKHLQPLRAILSSRGMPPP